MSTMVSQITSVSVVCSTVCSGADQRKHQRSASLTSVRGIHRSPMGSPHKGPVTQKMFLFDDVTMKKGKIFKLQCVRKYVLKLRTCSYASDSRRRKRLCFPKISINLILWRPAKSEISWLNHMTETITGALCRETTDQQEILFTKGLQRGNLMIGDKGMSCIGVMKSFNQWTFRKSILDQQRLRNLYKVEAKVTASRAAEMLWLDLGWKCTGSSPFYIDWPTPGASRPGEARGHCQRMSSREHAGAVGRDQQEAAGPRRLHRGSQGYRLSPEGHEDQGWTEHPHVNGLLLYTAFPSRWPHEQQTRAPQPPPTDTNRVLKTAAFESNIWFYHSKTYCHVLFEIWSDVRGRLIEHTQISW